MHWLHLSLIGIVLFSTSAIAQQYPLGGAWAYIDEKFPGIEVKACEAFTKFGVRKLSGNTVGEIIFFAGPKRYDFGGYADTESTNLSSQKLSDGSFKITDRWYDDGERGTRPGLKKKSYAMRMVDPATMEISEGSIRSRYVKCASKNDTPAQSPAGKSGGLPQKIGQCVSTTITSITDRFGEKVSPSPSKDGFDPGTAIQFANGGRQVSYEKETAIIRSKIGDQVLMCLKELPKDCPPGDNRGRVYNTKNIRTGEAWTLADSQHLCGGA
jgi:hypothetical protein